MLAGLIFTVVYIFLYKGWFFVPGTNSLSDTPAGWCLGISPASFGTIGALLNFAGAYAVSAVTRRPPAQVQELVESIRVPRGAAAATAPTDPPRGEVRRRASPRGRAPSR